MRIGIIGSGDVGRRLAEGFAGLGDAVVVGTRDPGQEALAAWAKGPGRGVRIAAPADAAGHGEVVVLAVRGDAVAPALAAAGPAALAGKLVLDATNPLDFSRGMPLGLFVGLNDSLGELVQRTLPSAHVVKCFNTVPNTLMVRPQLTGGVAVMMICGDDPAAKTRTTEILRRLGWPQVLDVGGIESARWLEALVPLWVRAGAALGGFDHMFTIGRASAPPP